MTQEQRDWGKIISIAVLTGILLMAALAGCTPYMYKSNQIKVTHVLAVTETGDTVKVAMRDIQPTKIYNVVGYDFVRGYNNPYYNPWRQYNMYDNYYRYYGSYMGTGNVVHATNPNNYLQPLPQVQTSGSNTTGGNGAPIAVNPVTQGGSSRGKNN